MYVLKSTKISRPDFVSAKLIENGRLGDSKALLAWAALQCTAEMIKGFSAGSSVFENRRLSS